MGQVMLNTKKLARDARMMLDSASAHLLATGVNNLNAYLYASMVRGALESAMSMLEAIADDDTDTYRQLSKLDAEAVALCTKFENMFDIQLKQAPAPVVPVLTVQPNGQLTQEQPVKRHVRHLGKSNGKNQSGRHYATHDITFRLSTSQRMEIWQWGQDHPNPTRAEIVELCEIYGTTDMTIWKWIKNHPGEHN